MNKLLLFFRKHGLKLAFPALAILLLSSFFLVRNNKQIIEHTIEVQRDCAALEIEVFNHINAIREMDVALRGYALGKKESYLYKNSRDIERQLSKAVKKSDSLLLRLNYTNPEGLKAIKGYQKALYSLIGDSELMVQHIRSGRDSLFFEVFFEDRGKAIHDPYHQTEELIGTFIKETNAAAKNRYNKAMRNNLQIQWLILILGLPTLGGMIYKLRTEEQYRDRLVKVLHKNNTDYLFNSGKTEENLTDKKVVESSIAQLKMAANFVRSIAKNDYSARWEGVSEENLFLNKETLAGLLISMRNELKQLKHEDDLRYWVNENFSKLLELLRSGDTLAEMADNFLSELVKILDAKIGMLFILNDEDENDEYLSLIAAYAFNRKKFIEQKIYKGDGLVGQAWLEKEPIFLKELPENYYKIKSSVGDILPTTTYIVPLIADEKFQGVIEIASLHELLPHQMQLIEKVSENLALTLNNLKVNEKTKALLQMSRMQSEELRAQEEEMRQNLEELEATQEELSRKEKSYIDEIERLNNELKNLNS